MVTKKPKKVSPIYIIKNRVLGSIKIDIPARIRKNIPWIATTDTTVRDLRKRLKQVPLETLFVINNESSLVAVFTSNAKVASERCKKKPGGGTGGILPGGEAGKCLALGEQACKDQGGCAFAGIVNGVCVIWCDDEVHPNNTIAEVFSL